MLTEAIPMNKVLLQMLIQTQNNLISSLSQQIEERVGIPLGIQLTLNSVQWSVETSLVPGLNGYDLLILPIRQQWRKENEAFLQIFLAASTVQIEPWLSVWAGSLEVDVALLFQLYHGGGGGQYH